MMKALLLVVLAAAFCAGNFARSGQNEIYIQGTWRLAGEHPGEEGAGSGWMLEWTFEKGRFRQTGYPPIEQVGRYRVAEETGSRVVLELTDQRGTFGSGDRLIEVVIDREADVISIDGRPGFSRVVPSG